MLLYFFSLAQDMQLGSKIINKRAHYLNGNTHGEFWPCASAKLTVSVMSSWYTRKLL